MVVDPLTAQLLPSFLSDHRIAAVFGPGASHGLFLGDFIGEQAVANHQVALRDVQAFLGHAGGDQEVEVALAETADGILLLVLRERPRSEGSFRAQLYSSASDPTCVM